jgi:hypothetical protein
MKKRLRDERFQHREAAMDIKKTFNEMSVLSPLLILYTVVYLGLMVYDFAARGAFELPAGMMVVYIALVTAYAADKEIRRWMGKEEPPRAGSFFVYAWLVFFLVAFVVRSFRPEFALPDDLSKVALQVLGVFFGSKASKKIYEVKAGKGAAVTLTREQTVMGLIGERGKVERRDVMAALKISDSTAGRLLAEMEEKKLIRQVGEHRDASYVASGS